MGVTGYENRLRPAQPATPAVDAFEIHRAEVADGLSLAYVREGVGGYPLLLIHGYPETKRVWWRNIEPLVAAGYEVIVPDLRGHGDSDLSADDTYDLVTYSRDLHTLVHDVLGHERCGVVGGDVGGVVAVDLANRFEGFVEGLCFFDTVPPLLFDDFAAAGIDVANLTAISDGPTGDYRRRQGAEPDVLAAELSTPAHRRLHRDDVRAPPVGLARHVQPGRHRLHDRAVVGRGAAARRVGRLPARLRPRGRRVADPRPQGRHPDAALLRGRRQRRGPRLHALLRGRVHQPGRAARAGRCRPLPPVGAGRRVQPHRRGVLRGAEGPPRGRVGGGPMSRFDHLAGRTPVVVGAAEVVHRAGEGFVPTSATGILLEAALDALASSGVSGALGPLVGEVLVPHGTWAEPDPGRAVAVAIGAPAARSVRSELGVLQLSLLGRAASAIAAGELEAALIVGGENRWSGVVSGKEGRPVPEPAHEAVAQEPDELIEPTDMIISPVEIERNLTTAAHQYAIVESALRHQLGRSIDEHQRWLGDLWADFARIAAEAPAGWDQRGLGADDIAVVSDTNRLIAAPYPKWLVSQWNVDQAAALVVTSVEVARRLGIDEDRWVFPAAVALSNLVVPLPERDQLHRWPAMGEVGAALRAHASAAPGGPRRRAGRPLQLLPGGGRGPGPGARHLPAPGAHPHGRHDLRRSARSTTTASRARRPWCASCVRAATPPSGSPPRSAVCSPSRPRCCGPRSAPTAPFALLDVTEAARAATATRAVDPDLVGPATIVGYTVGGRARRHAHRRRRGRVGRRCAHGRAVVDRRSPPGFSSTSRSGTRVELPAPGEFVRDVTRRPRSWQTDGP